ncbi:MAG: hypothetical protein V7608_5374 [Hyphomicrobiales bacterium]|jgi:hypothetical protein
MLKVTILVCSICAGGTALWLKSGPSSPESGTMAMPSIQELHLQAGAASLPDRTIKEAY